MIRVGKFTDNSTGMDISFMCNYKGMLYPLQLEPLGCAEKGAVSRKGKQSTKSLVDLCADKIVLDGSSTLRAMEVIPSELCYSLMKAALLNTRDRAIEVQYIKTSSLQSHL